MFGVLLLATGLFAVASLVALELSGRRLRGSA